MPISVCIATFNGAKYIKAQLASFLNQLGKDDEVIVSDDSSTDHTVEIIRQFNDSRIKLFTVHPKFVILNYYRVVDKFVFAIIFSSKRFQIMIYSIIGIYHFIFNRYGKYK